jgi:hypothetical protein
VQKELAEIGTELKVCRLLTDSYEGRGHARGFDLESRYYAKGMYHRALVWLGTK